MGWKIGDERVYALEGSAFIAGALVQWIRDGLGLIASAREIEELALQVENTGASSWFRRLAGLGAPHWDPEARGLICGITRGTTKAHIARAALEAIGLEVNDLLEAMAEDLGHPLQRLRVDGGAAANDLLMQFQADIGNVTIERPTELESTARGAAMLAGVGVGLFDSPAQAAAMAKVDRTFEPKAAAEHRASKKAQWSDAIRRARSGS